MIILHFVIFPDRKFFAERYVVSGRNHSVSYGHSFLSPGDNGLRQFRIAFLATDSLFAGITLQVCKANTQFPAQFLLR